MADAISLTVNEAGYVVGQPSSAINRAVDRGLIRAETTRRLRRVGRAELRFLAIAVQVDKDLTPAGRRKVYEAMCRLPAEAHRVDLGVLALDLADVDRSIAERMSRLRRVKALIDADGDGEPVLRGSAVPVHAVARLAREHATAEIGQDYPSLTPEQIEAAVEYAAVYPRAGRPLPTRSFKRMLADAAAAGAWDVADAP